MGQLYNLRECREKDEHDDYLRDIMFCVVFCLCLVIAIIVTAIEAFAQVPEGFGFVDPYGPIIQQVPAENIPPAEPMPPVVNVDAPPAAGEVAPPPTIHSINCPERYFYKEGACYPFLFADKFEAARHRYHLREGLALWGMLIQREEPAFLPVLSLDDIAPKLPFICANGFEVYPGSNLCSEYPDQATIEYHYNLGTLTNFQYWRKLQEVQNKQPEPPAFNCKRFGGQNIWKAKSERFNAPGAILDSASYCIPGIKNDMGPIQLSVVDAMGQRISAGQFRHCNTANGGRLHYDFPDMRGATGSAILLIEWEEKPDECFNIPEVSKDQR